MIAESAVIRIEQIEGGPVPGVKPTAFAIMRGLLVASPPTLLVPPTACVTGIECGRASPLPAPGWPIG
jgi:hypothetical protein